MQNVKLRIKKNIILAPYSTFHTGGKAEFFVETKNLKELKEAVDFAKKKRLKIFVLGGGSNVLLPDKGIRGLVLKIDIKGISFKDNVIYAGAGEKWDDVVAKAVSRNLGGIENLSLIPGTVGGAVYQNIGAYGAELKDVLKSVDVFDIRSGKVKKLPRQACQFGYRTSIFQKPEWENHIIIGALLGLSRKHILNIEYPDLTKYFVSCFSHDRGKNTIPDTTIHRIRKAVVEIRKSKLVYPTANIGTAGSFFKNPIITAASYRLLASSHPDIKGRSISNGLVKLSAGQLIEKAGWRGQRLGKVGVSSKHALVLVNYKGGKASDIIKLAKTVQRGVKNKFGVDLEPEVKIVL